jgi:hypothetical protein
MAWVRGAWVGEKNEDKMCRFDESRVCIVSEWVIPVLAVMIVEYDACPKKERHEWLSFDSPSTFETVCACTSEKRDRRFVYTHKDEDSRERTEFDGEARPVRWTRQIAFNGRWTRKGETEELENGVAMELMHRNTITFQSRRWIRGRDPVTGKTKWRYTRDVLEWMYADSGDLRFVMDAVARTRP